MRQAIDTAPRDGTIVILEDDASGTYDVAHWSAKAGRWVGENGELTKITPTHWYQRPRDQYSLQDDDGPPRRSAALPMTAILMAVGFVAVGLLYFQFFDSETLVPRQDAQKTDLALQQRAEADHARVKAGTQAKQAVEAPPREARQAVTTGQLTEGLANELARNRHAIFDGLDRQLQAEAANSARLLAQDRQNGTSARQEPAASTAQHRQAFDAERARTAALASELATAQREIEAQAAQFRKVSDETAQLRQAEAAKSAQLFEQERQRTAALTQEVAAARQELTAISAQHRQALDEERTRNAALASELSMTQREIEAQAAQLRKASDEAAQLKQAEAAKSAQSIEQEREKAAALAQETAAVRQELTASTAQHRQALDEERERAAALARQLATAQREIEAQAAQLRKASDETKQLKQVEAPKNVQSIDQDTRKRPPSRRRSRPCGKS